MPKFMMPVGDDGGDGGGGGDPKPAATPQYLTVEDFDKRLTGAMKNWGDKVEKRAVDREKASLDKLGSLFEEKFGAIKETLTAKPADGEPKPPKEDNRPSPEMIKLQGEFANLQKKLKDEEELRKSKETEMARREESSTLTDELTKLGVDPNVVQFARDALLARGLIARNEKGAVCWKKTSDEYGDEFVPLSQGVSDWVKTDEGKRVLPPTPANGTGSGGGTAPKRGAKMGMEEAIGAMLSGGEQTFTG